MDLLGRICAVVGISLVLTLLLLVLYQDDQSQGPEPPQPAITQATAAPADGTP